MDKFKKYIGWASLFLIVSCSNLSNLCRHQLSVANEFGYRDKSFDQTAPVFAFGVERKEPDFENAAPDKIQWDMLRDVTFELRFNKELQIDINYPIFGNGVRKLKGKEVYITGYLIPLNPGAGLYALSKNNFASCFFCGRAGPESIISLKFKTTPRRYKTDEYLTMKGKMELNDSNIRDYIYIFRETEEFTP